MSKSLTLEERYFISMYSRKLPCTVALRFSIDAFLQQIEITPEEVEKYDITIDVGAGTFECNDPDYTVEYEKFPTQVINAMERYVKLLDEEKNEDNILLQKILAYFRKLL